MKIDAYVNLHKTRAAKHLVYSIRHRGRVIGHTSQLAIKGPTFVVGKAGRERVRRERKKNVHAFVRGEIDEVSFYMNQALGKEQVIVVTPLTPVFVSYNPYKNETFVRRDTGEPITSAKHAVLAGSGLIAYL